MTLTINSTTTLANGVKMPLLGLGVFQTEAGQETEKAVGWALEAGYRHVDTATLYGNEQGVGNAVRRSKVSREEVFLTTKVWRDDLRRGTTRKGFEKSLAELGLDVVDLYLIHWPVGDYLAAWRVLEEIYAEGRARAIGVSNFTQRHLEEILAECQVAPAVNQIEFHPHLQQPELVAFCQQNNVKVEAWAPIMRGRVNEIPLLVALGQKHGKNAVQVTLRWMLQREIITIPKSSRQARIIENADLYDFELTEQEIALINQLDSGERLGPDPATL